MPLLKNSFKWSKYESFNSTSMHTKTLRNFKKNVYKCDSEYLTIFSLRQTHLIMKLWIEYISTKFVNGFSRKLLEIFTKLLGSKSLPVQWKKNQRYFQCQDETIGQNLSIQGTRWKRHPNSETTFHVGAHGNYSCQMEDRGFACVEGSRCK